MLLAAMPNSYAAAADRVSALPADLVATRTRLNLSQAAAAAAIGIGKETLARVESGTSNPTQTTILACLRWLSAS